MKKGLTIEVRQMTIMLNGQVCCLFWLIGGASKAKDKKSPSYLLNNRGFVVL